MPDITISDARARDAAALLDLRRRIFAETDFMLFAPAEYMVTVDALASQLEQVAASGHSRAIMARLAEEPVGFLGVNGTPVPRIRHSAQLYVGVLRSYWGRGVGRALINEALRWAPGAGVSRLELFVMKENSRARALYTRLGFRVEGTRRRAYVIDGRPVDDQLMAYVFGAG